MQRWFIMAAVAAILFCAGEDPAGTRVNWQKEQAAQDTVSFDYRFTATRDSLVLNRPETTIVYRFCSDSALETGAFTLRDSTWAILYRLGGNELRTEWAVYDGVYQAGRFADSTACLRMWMVYQRQGSGTGLTGVWIITGIEYELIEGTLTAAESSYFSNLQEKAADDIDSGMLCLYEIDEGTGAFVMRYVDWYYSLADGFLRDWQRAGYAVLYAVTTEKLDDFRVRLKGDSTRETVTIVWVETEGYDFTATFTSSQSTRAAHTYYSNPIFCPNEYLPPWFEEFLAANPKM